MLSKGAAEVVRCFEVWVFRGSVRIINYHAATYWAIQAQSPRRWLFLDRKCKVRRRIVFKDSE